jgi:hypothetical protein
MAHGMEQQYTVPDGLVRAEGMTDALQTCPVCNGVSCVRLFVHSRMQESTYWFIGRADMAC